eukprot:CAMPEP_0119359052 /NCGR_PEP_ID=MMETSP1334-20130426/7049_1 /TAXON_ID=127549 /ORGANISM="Calcidiscus leptoporus, Strain RCC1130" /LENGTH=38 /DNA_ID= /DNA_START= /DNA_END= /DNA_ORIENTATION=
MVEPLEQANSSIDGTISRDGMVPAPGTVGLWRAGKMAC